MKFMALTTIDDDIENLVALDSIILGDIGKDFDVINDMVSFGVTGVMKGYLEASIQHDRINNIFIKLYENNKMSYEFISSFLNFTDFTVFGY